MSEQFEGLEELSHQVMLQQQQITGLSHTLRDIMLFLKQQNQTNPAPQMKAVAGRLHLLDTTIEEMQKDWQKRDPRAELSELSKQQGGVDSTLVILARRLEEQERTLSIYFSWKYLALNVCMISFLAGLLSVLGTQWIVARPIQQQLNATRQENAVLHNHLQRIEKRLGVPKKQK
jgi:hypothetical protein